MKMYKRTKNNTSDSIFLREIRRLKEQRDAAAESLKRIDTELRQVRLAYNIERYEANRDKLRKGGN